MNLMKKELAVAPLPCAKIGDCFMHRHTVQYQIGSESGYVFDKSSPRFFACMCRAAAMAFRILFSYGRVARSYREKRDELTSEEFWTKHLGLSERD